MTTVEFEPPFVKKLFLLKEDGGKFLLEDESGYLLLESLGLIDAEIFVDAPPLRSAAVGLAFDQLGGPEQRVRPLLFSPRIADAPIRFESIFGFKLESDDGYLLKEDGYKLLLEE